MPKCSCSGCGETFTCLSAFDMHRVGSFGGPIFAASRSGKSQRVIGHEPSQRRCLTGPEMLAKGMVKNDKGWWLTRASEGHWTEDEEADEIEAASMSGENVCLRPAASKRSG